MSAPWIVEAENFWDTHCVDCSHDMHPMDICSAIIGGDQNGPDYCPCTLDYQRLAAEYQRSLTREPDATVKVARLADALRQLGINETLIGDVADGRTDIDGRVPS